MTSCVNVCDVKSADKRYACLKIVNNKTKLNLTCVSSHRCLGSPRPTCGQGKGIPAKRFISLEEINLFRPKQNYGFYLFDKSWYFPVKHVIYVTIFGHSSPAKSSSAVENLLSPFILTRGPNEILMVMYIF